MPTNNKRLALAKLGNKQRYTFRAKYCRCGYKAFKKHYTPTLLLTDVTYHHQEVTSHLWFTYTKMFLKLGQLHLGDIVQFNARVSTYYKGYGPSEEQTLDYQLSYPTKIKLINNHSKRMPLPTDSKHYPIVVGMAMKQNKSFYIEDMRPFSQFYVNLWNSWCEAHHISNESGILKQTDEAKHIVKQWHRDHSRLTGVQYSFPKLRDYLSKHHVLMSKLGVCPFGASYILSKQQKCIINHKQMVALLNLLHLTLTHAHGANTKIKIPSLKLHSFKLNQFSAEFHAETLFVKQVLIPYLSRLYCQAKTSQQAKIRKNYLLRFLSSPITNYNLKQLRYCILIAFIIDTKIPSNLPKYHEHVIKQLLNRYAKRSSKFTARTDVLNWVKKQFTAHHISLEYVLSYIPKSQPKPYASDIKFIHKTMHQLKVRVINDNQGSTIPTAKQRKQLNSMVQNLRIVSGYNLPKYIENHYPNNDYSFKLKAKFKSHNNKYWLRFFSRFMMQFKISL